MNEENKISGKGIKIHDDVSNVITFGIDYEKLKDTIITAIKKKWIEEYDSLEEDRNRDGYFLAGFVSDVLNDLFPTKD